MLFWRRKKKNDMDALFDQMGNTIDAINDIEKHWRTLYIE